MSEVLSIKFPAEQGQADLQPEVSEPPFSYEGYQVVRGEFFSHLFEPSVTLGGEKVHVNAACINKLPEVEYVQFLVNPNEKKLAVKPCSEEDKDSFRWSSISKDGKRKPKTITCRIFFAKVVRLMGWSSDHRYKILGKLVKAQNDTLFVFDLSCAEAYKKRTEMKDGSINSPFYPSDWSDQFGLPVSEHNDTTLIEIFNEYTVFKIDKEEENNAARQGAEIKSVLNGASDEEMEQEGQNE